MLGGTECMTMIFIRVCLADKWTPKSVGCNKFVACQKEVNVDVLVNCSSFFAGCLCVQEWTLAALSLANTRTIMHTSGQWNWSDVECTIIPLLWSRLDLFSSFVASDWYIFVDAVEAHSCLGSKCLAVDWLIVVYCSSVNFATGISLSCCNWKAFIGSFSSWRSLSNAYKIW